MAKYKICNVCNKNKGIDEFSKKSSNKSGYSNRCKQCSREYSRKHTKYITSINKDILDYKYCAGCKKDKLSNDFSKNRCKKDGLCNYCKACDTKKANNFRKKNRQRKSVDIPESKLCCRCKKVKKSKQFIKNKSLKSGLNPYCNQCTSNIMSIQNSKRRARKLKVQENFTPEDADIVKRSCYYECVVCDSKNKLSIDHFKPLSRGNTLCIGNAIILCTSCNSRKSNKNPRDFLSSIKYNDALVSIAVSDILKNGVG